MKLNKSAKEKFSEFSIEILFLSVKTNHLTYKQSMTAHIKFVQRDRQRNLDREEEKDRGREREREEGGREGGKEE